RVRTVVGRPRRVLEIAETPEPPLAEGRFRGQTLFTGLSAGTELTWYRGSSPYFRAGWDAELGLVDSDRAGPRAAGAPRLALFTPARRALGPPWARRAYREVARVTDSRPPAVAEGALVAMAY